MKTIAELESIRQQLKREMALRTMDPHATRVIVGMGDSGLSTDAREVLKTVMSEVDSLGLQQVIIMQNDYDDQNGWAPVIWIECPGEELRVFARVKPEDVKDILVKALVNKGVK